MNKKLTLTGANLFFLVFTAVFIAYQFVLAIVLGKSMDRYMYQIVLVNEFIMILGSVLIYCAIMKIPIRQTFRFNNPGLKPLLLIVLLSVPAYFVASMLNNVLVYFLQFIGNLPSQPIPVPHTIPELVQGILIIAVSPAICEEIMHRGLLLRAYEKRGSYRAVVIVAIFFGIFHFDITNFLGPVFLGLVIGYYVVRTNSIFAGMLAHFLNNTIAEILTYLSRNQVQQKYMTISSRDLVEALLYGFGGLIITAVLLIVFKKLTEGRSSIVPPISRAGGDAKAVLTHWPVIVVIALYIIMMLIYLMSVVMLKMFGT